MWHGELLEDIMIICRSEQSFKMHKNPDVGPVLVLLKVFSANGKRVLVSFQAELVWAE